MDCSHIKLIAELIWDESETSIAQNHIGSAFHKALLWDDYPLFSGAIKVREDIAQSCLC